MSVFLKKIRKNILHAKVSIILQFKTLQTVTHIDEIVIDESKLTIMDYTIFCLV